jgi:hypothetical protein
VVRAQVELLSVQVLKKLFQCRHYGKQFQSGDAVNPLGFIQRLTVLGYDSLLSVLYLGEHSSNSDVIGISVHNESLSWMG